VIELALILAINLGGLSFAVLLARWLAARDAGSAEVRRLGAAVVRATDAFLWREFQLVAVAVVLWIAIVFGGHAVLLGLGKPFGSFETAFWSAVGLGLGAISACGAAYAGGRLGASGSTRMLSATRQSLDRALKVSVRATGAAGLMVETLSLLGVCSLFGLVYSMKGGFALPAEHAGPLALRVAVLLPGYALGAVSAALIVQRGGSIFHVAGDVGGDVAGERDAGLGHDDARNPAAVTDLVGDHVGPAAARACDLFVSATIANVAALIIGASVQEANRAELAGALSVALFPAVVRAFGVIATCFGLFVVRANDYDNPNLALGRGHITASCIALGGLAGASIWLVGEPHWRRLFIAGLVGVVAVMTIAYSVQYRTDRRFAPLREVLETLRGSDAIAVAHGLALGLEAVLLPIFGLGAAMAAAWHLGASTGLQGGGLLGSLAALTAMLATASYVLAVGNFGAMADSARGVAGISLSEDTERRTSKLDAAGFLAASIAQTYLIVVGCSAALIAAAALPLLSGQAFSGGGIDLSKPAVAWSGGLGAAFVLAYSGSAISGASRGARGIALEVERQLRPFPRQDGLAVVPSNYVPSYRTCIDLVSRIALSRVLVPVAIALLLPAGLGIALRLMYRSGDPGLWAEGLMSFVVVASVTGLGAALAVDAARATLGAARRASRLQAGNSGFGASITGDAVADLIGNSAGPAAYLVVKAAAVSSLIVASFLT
jgi:K(+)-stimulated pyrophosphate-energized sodium pump